jgi:hypothetical protein
MGRQSAFFSLVAWCRRNAAGSKSHPRKVHSHPQSRSKLNRLAFIQVKSAHLEVAGLNKKAGPKACVSAFDSLIPLSQKGEDLISIYSYGLNDFNW